MWPYFFPMSSWHNLLGDLFSSVSIFFSRVTCRGSPIRWKLSLTTPLLLLSHLTITPFVSPNHYFHGCLLEQLRWLLPLQSPSPSGTVSFLHIFSQTQNLLQSLGWMRTRRGKIKCPVAVLDRILLPIFLPTNSPSASLCNFHGALNASKHT